MKKIKVLLSELAGVISVSQIAASSRDKIRKLENDYENGGIIGLRNLGIQKVMECNTVYAILKDTSFRPPPGPTVYMVEDSQPEDNEKKDYILKIDNNNYRIVGEELIGNKPQDDEPTMFISDDFVLYPERRKGRKNRPAFFIIPPIGFSELERVKEAYRISNIISISPSTMADDYIRKTCSFSLKENLATILIGFDMENYS